MNAMNNSWTQIDIKLTDFHTRFFMNTCNGRDQVVYAISKNGWDQYEPPLPTLVYLLCRNLNCHFIDVGANTGYYSLLAAASGAIQVDAYEPIPEIYEILNSNIQESDLSILIKPHQIALGSITGTETIYLPDDKHGLIETSASLNPKFREKHSKTLQIETSTIDTAFKETKNSDNREFIIKIDTETTEPAVIMGGETFITRHRPFIIAEILPEGNIDFFEDFQKSHRYTHIWLNPEPKTNETPRIQTSLHFRDHFFIPEEKTEIFLQAINSQSSKSC